MYIIYVYVYIIFIYLSIYHYLTICLYIYISSSIHTQADSICMTHVQDGPRIRVFAFRPWVTSELRRKKIIRDLCRVAAHRNWRHGRILVINADSFWNLVQWWVMDHDGSWWIWCDLMMDLMVCEVIMRSTWIVSRRLLHCAVCAG